jgi:hypothetical protein
MLLKQLNNKKIIQLNNGQRTHIDISQNRLKKCSASLIIRETHFKTTVWHHFAVTEKTNQYGCSSTTKDKTTP